MFATATKNFVNEVDRDGSLIPVSSLNDTFSILTVVIKKKRLFWQKPKYRPTDFKLNDLLEGDTPIEPVLTESEFLKYNGTYGDNIQAKVDASFIKHNVSIGGKDTSKLQSPFGSLKKEELDAPKLLEDSKERVLDMSHCLVEQTMNNHKQVFGIVKERIQTTQPCSVIEEVQKEGQCSGLLSLCGPTVTKVSLKENTSLGKDSNITMEIPPCTTIAYALMELEVKHDGHFKLCLMSGTNGGFEEVDGRRPLAFLSAPFQFSENISPRQALDQINEHFVTLAALEPQIKSALLQQILNVIGDRAALTALENTLDHIVSDDCTVSEGARDQQTRVILDLAAQSSESQSVIKALHLTLSAIEELPDESLAPLTLCCNPTLLPDLMLMGQCALGNGELPQSALKESTLTEEVYERVQHLFGTCKVLLKKDGDTLRTETQQEAGNLPLILCIAVRGLTVFT